MSNIFAEPTCIAYFDKLESPAFSAVQTAWDRIVINRMGPKFIQSSFNKDMLALGYLRPSDKDFGRFIADCEAGKIERPTRGTSEPEIKEAPAGPSDIVVATDVAAEAEGPAIEGVTAEGAFIAETAIKAITLDALPVADPVEILTSRLMLEAMADLQRDLEKQARRRVAERLREIADAYELGELLS